MNSLPSYGKLLRGSASYFALDNLTTSSNSTTQERGKGKAKVSGRNLEGPLHDVESATHTTSAGTWKGDLALAKSLFSALLYGCVAIAMNFVNKATLMQFHYSNTILLLQMVSGVVVVQALRALRLIECRHISWRRGLSLLPVAMCYNLNVAAALMGLDRVNIPVYSTVKRLTPMLVLGYKIFVTRRMPQHSILLSVAIVVLGCVIAGAGDLSFDAAGYAFAFLSCSFQATYLIVVEQTGSERGIGSAELLLYNSVLSLPFLLVVMVLTGEIYDVREAYWAAVRENHVFPLLLLTCSSMGCLLNYALFLCTMNNSALTTTIVGVLKGVLSTILGFFLLGGVKFNLLNVVGICMNTLGGALYTISKYRKRNTRTTAGLELGRHRGDLDPLRKSGGSNLRGRGNEEDHGHKL